MRHLAAKVDNIDLRAGGGGTFLTVSLFLFNKSPHTTSPPSCAVITLVD